LLIERSARALIGRRVLAAASAAMAPGAPI